MTKKPNGRRRVRRGLAASPRHLGGALQFGPWIAASLLVVALLWQSDSAARSGLFQSPPTVTPTSAATDTPEPTATQPPTDVPTPTDVVPPTAAPTETMPPAPSPTLPPDLTATPTLTFTATPAITVTPTITDTEAGDAGEGGNGTGPERTRYPDEGSNVEFEWGMLFDSVALALSYGWLCCGVVVMLLLPVSFLALWVAARRRRQRME